MSSGAPTEAADWRARVVRAEAALGGPAEDETVEIFEIEEEGGIEAPADAEREAPAGAEAEAEADAAPEASALDADSEAPADAEPADDDPGAVLEDDVAAVIAEGEALEAESNEDPRDGAVPSSH